MLNNKKRKETLSSVTNAMKILRLFTHKQKEWRLSEIAEQLNLPLTTTHRLISTLREEGFLSKNPKNNHYRLGLAILSLGGAVFNHHELYKEAMPIVKELSEQLNETAHLCLMENGKVVYLFRTKSPHPDRLVTQTGRTGPVHCTSEGLCILAYQEEEYIQQFLEQDFYAYTPYTITDCEQLYDLLRTIRQQGYCVQTSTYFENFVSLAAPIRDYSQHVVASLSVIGSRSRMTDEKLPIFIEKTCKPPNKSHIT